jgi:hypothetical protein
MRLLSVAAVVLGCVVGQAALAAGEDAQSAKGKFESKGVSVEVGGAYAFRTTSSFGSDKILNVVVSNAGISTQFAKKWLDPWLDRRQFFEKRFKDDETAVINFEFTPEGVYQGVSYWLGSSNGCGYCAYGEAKSTVKLVAGRLAGTLSYKGEARSWEIAIDVPVASDDRGAALPAGGGDPGSAYLSYSAALKAGDAAAIKKLIVAPLVENMDKAEKSGELDSFVGMLAGSRYVDTVQVDSGFATAETAVLAVSGSGPVGKRAGQVLLRKEQGGWRVDDEILDMVVE